jgi:hypothetical protein
MSHQDPVRCSAAGTHAAALYQVFQKLTSEDCFKDIRFRRDCAWSPQLLVFAAMLWSWGDFSKLGKRFQHSLKIIEFLCKKQDRPKVSYQAFMELLHRWTEPLLDRLKPAFRKAMQTSLAAVWRVGTRVVFAADGSRVGVPRTRRNEERYSPKSKLSRKAQKRRRQSRGKKLRKQAREEQANVPRIWLTMLWHVGSGLLWDWRTGPGDSSERDHLEQMLDKMPTGSLLMADAGFVGYRLWNKILKHQIDLLIRVGSNVRLLKKLGYAQREGNCVYLWPDQAAKKNLPPLVLRLIVLRKGGHPVYLVTNLPAGQLPNREARDLYSRRWGVEVQFRNYKQTFDRAKLRSKSPDNALVELQWSLVSVWAMGLHAHEHHVQKDVAPSKVSFVGILDAFRDAMRDYRHRPARGESMQDWIELAVIDDYMRTNKSSRDYPQQKQRRPPGAPKLRVATASQKLKAKHVKQLQSKGLMA